MVYHLNEKGSTAVLTQVCLCGGIPGTKVRQLYFSDPIQILIEHQ